MAGKVDAFSTAFEKSYVIRYDLEHLYGGLTPVLVFADSRQLFDVLTKATHPCW